MSWTHGETPTSATLTERVKDTSRSAATTLCFSEVISALSFALDLTEGAVQGHALRSCLIGMRIATALGLPDFEVHNLYYALMLKDIGCSSNAARMCQIIGGNEILMKSAVKLEDWTKPNKPKLSTLKMLWTNVLPEARPTDRLARIVKIGMTQHKNNEELITMRCDRGASIIRKLGLGEIVAEAVRCLDEHWDGSGYPERLIGSRIPLLSRIMLVAQHLDIFSIERGAKTAVAVLFERSGTWFDPELAGVAARLHSSGSLWKNCLADAPPEETRRAVLDIEPGRKISLEADGLDRVCEAFADVVDAKSPFTFRHSMGVAHAALSIAKTMGMSEERTAFIRRTALLHDIGKLNVSNSILDKTSKLNVGEWQSVREHPNLTRRILEKVGAFQEIAVVAGEHHEKLDGSGYPNSLSAKSLSLEARIIAVADVYGALTENRPYREGLSLQEVVAIMGKDIPGKLDGDCFEALIAHIGAP